MNPPNESNPAAPRATSSRGLSASRRRSNAGGPSWVPLATRLLATTMLAIGGLVWMSSLKPAMGQFPNQNFQTPQNFGGQGFTPQNFPTTPTLRSPGFQATPAATSIPSPQSIPAIPASQADVSAEDAAPDAEASGISAGWDIPPLVQKITQGGWLMVPLVLCSFIVMALSLERLIALRRGRVIPRPFVRRFTECVEDGQLSYDEATAICEEFDCPVAEVFRAAVRRWGRPMFEIEQAVMDAGDRVSESLKRFLRVFHAISNVAPLLGLLGTVLGMIQAFEIISSQEGAGNPELLASGISVALITTAGGLSVAIPAYIAYMYFSSKSDRYLNEIDKLCQKVIDSISAEALETSGSGRSRKKKAA